MFSNMLLATFLLNSALTAWKIHHDSLACVGDHVNNFSVKKRKRGWGLHLGVIWVKKSRGKHATAWPFLMQHWHNFHPPETHTHTRGVNFYFIFIHIFFAFLFFVCFIRLFALTAASIAPLFMRNESSSCVYEYFLLFSQNPKSRKKNNISDVYRTHIMRIISIDHILGFLKLF